MIKLYQPWPAPVLAACLTGPAVLPEIARWIAGLRDQGRIPPDIRFVLEPRAGSLIGVLHTGAGRHELSPGSFLVFTQEGLQVLTSTAFFEHYYEPARSDTT